MANALINDLAERLIAAATDLMPVASDPGGTHTGHRATLEQVIAAYLSAGSADVGDLDFEDVLQLNMPDGRQIAMHSLGDVLATAQIQWPPTGKYFRCVPSTFTAGSRYQFFHFFGHPLNTAAGDAGMGSIAAGAVDSGLGPAVRFGCQVGSGSYWYNQTTSVWIRCNQPIYFEWLIKLNQATNTRIYLGLGSFGVASNLDTPEVSFVGFCFRNTGPGVDDTTWQAVTQTATAGPTTFLDTLATAQTATAVKLSLLINSTGTSAEFFVNDTSVGTIATNLPTGVNLGPTAQGVNTVNGATPGFEFYRMQGRWQSIYE